MDEKRRGRRFLVLILLAVAVTFSAVFAWLLVSEDVPPDAATVVGHPVPVGARTLGSDRYKNDLLGRDGIDRAVIEIDETRFNQYRNDAGFTPFRQDLNVFDRSSSDPPWWDISNLPDSPVYQMERKDAGGTISYHYLKYERGRAYVVRSFYGKR